jgi:hypothetical protein
LAVAGFDQKQANVIHGIWENMYFDEIIVAL